MHGDQKTKLTTAQLRALCQATLENVKEMGAANSTVYQEEISRYMLIVEHSLKDIDRFQRAATAMGVSAEDAQEKTYAVLSQTLDCLNAGEQFFTQLEKRAYTPNISMPEKSSLLKPANALAETIAAMTTHYAPLMNPSQILIGFEQRSSRKH